MTEDEEFQALEQRLNMKEQEYEQINHPNGVTTWKTKPKHKEQAMNKQQEALKLALEALEWINRVNAMDYEYQQKARESLNAIYEAMEERQEPLTDEEIKRLKPLSADFVSFRAGVRCMEREYGIGAKR